MAAPTVAAPAEPSRAVEGTAATRDAMGAPLNASEAPPPPQDPPEMVPRDPPQMVQALPRHQPASVTEAPHQADAARVVKEPVEQAARPPPGFSGSRADDDGDGGGDGHQHARPIDFTHAAESGVAAGEGTPVALADKADGTTVGGTAADNGRRFSTKRMGLQKPDGTVYSPTPIAWMTDHEFPWEGSRFGRRGGGASPIPTADPMLPDAVYAHGGRATAAAEAHNSPQSSSPQSPPLAEQGAHPPPLTAPSPERRPLRTPYLSPPLPVKGQRAHSRSPSRRPPQTTSPQRTGREALGADGRATAGPAKPTTAGSSPSKPPTASHAGPKALPEALQAPLARCNWSRSASTRTAPRTFYSTAGAGGGPSGTVTGVVMPDGTPASPGVLASLTQVANATLGGPSAMPRSAHAFADEALAVGSTLVGGPSPAHSSRMAADTSPKHPHGRERTIVSALPPVRLPRTSPTHGTGVLGGFRSPQPGPAEPLYTVTSEHYVLTRSMPLMPLARKPPEHGFTRAA